MDIGKEKIEIMVDNYNKGDRNTENKIIRAFEGYIYTVSCSYFIKDYDMEDLLQLGRISVYKALQHYDKGRVSNGFIYYAMNAIKNNFKYEFRKHKKNNFVISLDDKFDGELYYKDVVKSEENIEGDFIKIETYKKLRQAVNELPKLQREIIIWVYFEDKALKDYATLHNMSYSSVRYHRNAGEKYLRSAIKVH